MDVLITLFYLLEKINMSNPSLPLIYKIKISNITKEKKPCLVLLHGYGSNEDDLLRDLAHTATSYNNKSYRFSDRTVFAEDLMKHGILELVG